MKSINYGSCLVLNPTSKIEYKTHIFRLLWPQEEPVRQRRGVLGDNSWDWKLWRRTWDGSNAQINHQGLSFWSFIGVQSSCQLFSIHWTWSVFGFFIFRLMKPWNLKMDALTASKPPCPPVMHPCLMVANLVLPMLMWVLTNRTQNRTGVCQPFLMYLSLSIIPFTKPTINQPVLPPMSLASRTSCIWSATSTLSFVWARSWKLFVGRWRTTTHRNLPRSQNLIMIYYALLLNNLTLKTNEILETNLVMVEPSS